MSEQRGAQRAKQRAVKRQPVNTNQFDVPPEIIPDGMSWEFKRYTYGGKEDVKHMNNMLRNGFTPVPNKRAAEIVGAKLAGEKPEEAAIIDGLMLMERPMELRREADQEYLQEARDQVSNQIRRLGLNQDGQLPRTKAKVNRKFDIPVAEGDDYER